MRTDAEFNKSLHKVWEVQKTSLRKKLDEILTQHIKKNKLLDYYKKISDKKHKLALEYIVARHGFFVLWRDEALDEFSFMKELYGADDEPISFGEGYSLKERSKYYRELVFGPGYALASGAGSAGLGVRLGRGVCLRDTVRDTRGEVAFEDILAQNYSFMGIPIWRKNQDEKNSMPFGLFCLLYPARGAWHRPFKGEIEHVTKSPLCLYNVVQDFVDKDVRPVVEILSEFFELRSMSVKLKQLSAIGRGAGKGDGYRRGMLEAIVGVDNDSESSEQGNGRDLLGFRTAYFYEHAAREQVKPQEELQDLFTAIVKRRYASFFKHGQENQQYKIMLNGELPSGYSWHNYNIVDSYVLRYFAEHPADSLQEHIREFWLGIIEKASSVPENLWPALDSTELIDAEIEKNILLKKWRGVLLYVAGKALVGTLVGKENALDAYTFLQGLLPDAKLPTFPGIINQCCSVAMIAVSNQWSIIKEKVSASDARMVGKLNFELFNLPFTRNTLFRLLGTIAASKEESSKAESTTVALGNGGVICSDAFFSRDKIIDHGSYTALAAACGNGNISLNIDQSLAGYDLKFINDARDNGSFVAISVAPNGEGRWSGIAFEFAKGVTFKYQSADNAAEGRPDELADTVRKCLLDAGSGCGHSYDALRPLCFPCVTNISGTWYVKCLGGKPEDKECTLPDSFKEAASSLIEKLHPQALAAGVNSFVLSPLWIEGEAGNETACEGFILLGSPRREYDKSDRVSYTESQLSAIRSFTDYFEMTIAQERHAVVAEQQRIEAEKSRILAGETAHLAGVENEMRQLIEDVNQMKRAAERVARKIAPADYGDLSFDSDTVKLFRPKSQLYISIEKQGQDGSVQPPEEFIRGIQTWQVGNRLKISEPTQNPSENVWRFKTIHSSDELTSEKEWKKLWDDYQLVFKVLGWARSNLLLRAFGNPGIIDNMQNENEKKLAISRLFNSAKLLFHRIHYPGNNLNHLFTIQLLAALLSAKQDISFSCNMGAPTKISFSKGLINFIRDDYELVSAGKIDDCHKLQIYGRVNDCVPALSRFAYELTQKTAQPVILLKINVNVQNSVCQVEFLCDQEHGEGCFDDNKLNREEVMAGGLDAQREHGLTSSVLTLEKCLKCFISKGKDSGAFCYYFDVGRCKKLTFSLKFLCADKQ